MAEILQITLYTKSVVTFNTNMLWFLDLYPKLGKTFLVFVEEGTSVTASLKKCFAVIRRFSGRRKFTLQQNGARCHTANSVILDPFLSNG